MNHYRRALIFLLFSALALSMTPVLDADLRFVPVVTASAYAVLAALAALDAFGRRK
jgi:hypothetical protein